MILFYILFLPGFLITLPEKAFSDQQAKLWNNESLPFVSLLKYRKLKGEGGHINYTDGKKQACYYKEDGVQHEMKDDKGIPMKGKYVKVTFSHLYIAKFAALDNYDSELRSMPVSFHTKWRSSNDTAYEKLVNSLLKQTVLNISFTTTVRPSGDNYCEDGNHVPLDIAWCKWAQVFGQHRQGKDGLPWYDASGQCVGNRTHEAQHYLNMWYTGDSEDFKGKCVGTDRDACPVKRTSLHASSSMNSSNAGEPTTTAATTVTSSPCLHRMFMANGKGLVKKMNVGKSTYHPHYNGSQEEYIDINMTVSFEKWTSDFPELFTSSYKHCLYYGNVSEMTVDLFLLDKVEREIPMQFFAFMVVAAVLGIVVLIALTLVVCTCSTKGFRMELWEFWEKRNAYRKYAKEHASEIAEQAADKRMEKQEAMMSSMMGD